MKNQFGVFVNKKRTEKQISLRAFSNLIGISPEYLSKIENGLRAAPNDAIVNKIAKVLILSEEEQEKLYDLAAMSKKYPALAQDLVEYINSNKKVHQFLRMLKRYKADDEDLQVLICIFMKKHL